MSKQVHPQDAAPPASPRGRIGLAISRPSVAAQIDAIVATEAAGIEQVWMTMGALGTDALTVFAAAAMRTERVVMGTSIVPAFTRHPLGMATQALALAQLAPGRLRLGIGTSHGPQMRAYGVAQALQHPLSWLQEYLEVLRPAMQGGSVAFQGQHFQVEAKMPRSIDTPLLISALRPNAWELAGSHSDGGISWLCPPAYLLEQALPALQRGADAAGQPRPALVAHVPVALSSDLAEVRQRARTQFAGYSGLPFYANMFAQAGYPIGADRAYSDALLDHLVVSGDEEAVAQRLRGLLDSGLDELLVMHVPGADAGAAEAEEARLRQLLVALT